MAGKGLIRDGVDGNFSRLIHLDIDDVRLIDLDFGRDNRHVGNGHDGTGSGALHTGNHGFANTNRQVGDQAVNRSNDVVFTQNVIHPCQPCLGLRNAFLTGGHLGFVLRQLAACLNNARSSFRDRRLLALEGGAALFEIRFGDETLREQLFAALEVEFITFEIRFGPVQGGG